MKQIKVLIVHSPYLIKGGEDTVVDIERKYLADRYQIDTLFFNNKSGGTGALTFIMSLWNIFAARRLRKKIKTFAPDIIHVHNWHFGIGPIIFHTAKRMGVPIVCTVHNYRMLCPTGTLFYNGDIFLSSLEKSSFKDAIERRVYRNSLFLTLWLSVILKFHGLLKTWNLSSGYVFLSSFSKDLHIKQLNLNPNSCFVKPNSVPQNGVVMHQFQNSFCFVGRLTQEKGYEVLLRAFTLNRLKLEIAGEGNNLQFESLSNIEFLGRIDNNQVLNLLSHSKALIFPSIWFEGMPMTIIEAFSVGTPVIASNLGAMSTMIQDGVNGFLFKAGDANSLNAALDKLNELSHDEYIEMRAKAYASYQRIYHPRNQEGYFEEIYNTVIENGKINR